MKNRLFKTMVIGVILSVILAGGLSTKSYAWNQDEMIEVLKRKMIEDGLDPDDARSTGGTAKSKAVQQMQNNQMSAGEISNITAPSGEESKKEEPKHTHKYSSKVLKNPTCTEEGEVEYTCDCGNSYIEKVKKLEHVYEEEVTKEASCEEDGEKNLVCSVCKDTKKEKILALGHEEGLWSVSQDPTCTEGGVNSNYCKNGGEVLKTEIIPAKGHTEGEWIIEKESTMFQKGENVQRCSVCNEILETEELSINMIGWYIVIGGIVLAGLAVFIGRKVIKKNWRNI